MQLSMSNQSFLNPTPAWMIRFAVLSAACLLFLPGCTDNLTSPEVKQEATTTGTDPNSKNLAKNENLAKNVRSVEYETGTTAVGNDVYVDRDYTITEVPSSFQDWTYVRTANATSPSRTNRPSRLPSPKRPPWRLPMTNGAIQFQAGSKKTGPAPGRYWKPRT